MFKRFLILAGLLALGTTVNAQKFKKLPESKISESFPEKHIRFLASDALLGRKTGEPGNNAAAAYIAEEWRSYGVKPATNNGFYQTIPFVKLSQPKNAFLLVDGDKLEVNKDFIVLAGDGASLKNVVTISVGYGWASEDGTYNDYKDSDVKGKIVIAQLGTPDTKAFREMFAASERKQELAKQAGAVALIEIMTIPAPWEAIQSNFSERLTTEHQESSLTRILIPSRLATKISGQQIDFNVPGLRTQPMPSNNVAGIIEGSDPVLKKEYVILSAHYDHIGHRDPKSAEDDFIFNGARDNAIGVAGLMTAAKSLALKPPKRSVLLLAFTAEEMGLLGSRYYAENPLIPLNQCVYNLNIDGAGYNDTRIITGLGMERTGAYAEVKQAVEQLGLRLADDPVPEQGLFDRSDNVNFAAKGIPAPTFSPGFTAFDETLMRFYHKEADEVTLLDFDYCHRFAQAYSYAARLVANRPLAPKWQAGDKYEGVSKQLYGN